MAGRINWNGTKVDYIIIGKIVARADDLAESLGKEPVPQLVMDIAACHLNGCPLDLAKLLAFPDFDFAHDVYGIHRHIDRTTGELGDSFLPRCAMPERQAVRS